MYENLFKQFMIGDGKIDAFHQPQINVLFYGII